MRGTHTSCIATRYIKKTYKCTHHACTARTRDTHFNMQQHREHQAPCRTGGGARRVHACMRGLDPRASGFCSFAQLGTRCTRYIPGNSSEMTPDSGFRRMMTPLIFPKLISITDSATRLLHDGSLLRLWLRLCLSLRLRHRLCVCENEARQGLCQPKS
eukprot:COSAG02_NODE_4756_length_5022_cov_1.825107_8_plen_158_part_00